MNPSRLFILRPVATALTMVAILLIGAVAYRYLPLSALPEADYPTIQIQTFYPGASPEVMTSAVTAPLERQLGQMPGLQQMSSSSSAGASNITLQFTLSISLDVAEQEVQAAINAASSLLPTDLPAPPVYAGFVIDDAIVMIENIARYIEAGMAPREAALRGSQEIGFTIVSLTISLVAVLIPLLFMGDVVGRLFREFAVTLAVTILISAVVSLTLVPMLCAKLMRHRQPSQIAAWQRWTEERFERLIAAYGRVLNRVLDRPNVTLLVAVATLAATALLYFVIPKGFFPVQDTGLIQGVSEAPASISFQAMSERQQALAAAVLRDPDVDSLSSFIGVDGVNATVNSGRLLINLKPRNQGHASAEQIIHRLSATTASVSGITLFMQPVQDLTLDASTSRTQYKLALEDARADELALWTPRLVDRLSHLPQLTDVTSDDESGGDAVMVQIDRATAGRYGITPSTIDNALDDAFGQRIVSTIFTQSNQYRVILEADPKLRITPQSLDAIYLSGPSGAQVPLSAVVSVSRTSVPLRINHLDQFSSTSISFNLAAGRSLRDGVAQIRQAAAQIGLPASIVASFQGAARAFQASLSNELLLILAAIVTMYIVLGVLYESFIHPLTILSTLPSAGMGALLALFLVGNDLGVIGIIGIVLLIGIVKKNAIMMVDFAIEARRVEGKSAHDAIYQACLLRFRPILMTTMAALLGALPLMVGGTGSELRYPLGVSIVGGLVVSQLLTLFTTPVIYLAFDRLPIRLARVLPADGDGVGEPLLGEPSP